MTPRCSAVKSPSPRHKLMARCRGATTVLKPTVALNCTFLTASAAAGGDVRETASSSPSHGTFYSSSSAVASPPLPRLFALSCFHFLLPGCLHLVLRDENLIRWKKRNPGVEIKRSSAPPLLQLSEPVKQHLCSTPEDKVRVELS